MRKYSTAWDIRALDPEGRISVAAIGPFGTFYRSCLRSILGVSREIRNELLYILSSRPPFRVYVAKAPTCSFMGSVGQVGCLASE